jgi:hypothetical protein
MSRILNEPPVLSIFQTELAEQRSRTRYPIRLGVEVIFNKNGITQRGFGKTLNISSAGILFETKLAVPARGLIDLLLNWPVRLDGSHPLKLAIRGRIVRTDHKGVAIKFTQHEFRIARTRRFGA